MIYIRTIGGRKHQRTTKNYKWALIDLIECCKEKVEKNIYPLIKAHLPAAMTDLENIENFAIPRPDGWTIFGNAAQFDALPEATKDQVFFLSQEATDYLFDYVHIVQLITGGGWDPFAKGNFKTVETFHAFYGDEEGRQLLKKWLYHRGLPFSNRVFLLQNSNEPAILTTWKMIIRYAPFIFPGDDVLVFDKTLNWCLFYYHENKLFFGKDNVYDPSEDEKKMEALNERKKKFPRFRHPYW